MCMVLVLKLCTCEVLNRSWQKMKCRFSQKGLIWSWLLLTMPCQSAGGSLPETFPLAGNLFHVEPQGIQQPHRTGSSSRQHELREWIYKNVGTVLHIPLFTAQWANWQNSCIALQWMAKNDCFESLNFVNIYLGSRSHALLLPLSPDMSVSFGFRNFLCSLDAKPQGLFVHMLCACAGSFELSWKTWKYVHSRPIYKF